MSNSKPLRGRTLLVVNSGSIKKRFTIQRLKKLGAKLLVLNKERPTWALNYVSHWIIADTDNHKESLERLKLFLHNHPEIRPDGVITFWEDDVLLAARIAERLNLPGIPFATAKRVRNKFLFREFCRLNKLPAPKYQLIQGPADLRNILKKLSFPLVLKPAYGSSSAFVIKVEDRTELQETYEYIQRSISSGTESALSEGLQIMAEEYIDGDEVDIDILLQNGKIKFFSITDNYKTAEPFFIETGMAIPSSLPSSNQTELVSMAEEVLEKLGVQNGCLHFEAKSTKHGAVPIEVNLRLGGDEVYSFVKGAWGVDLIEQAAKIAMGEYIKVEKPAIPFKYLSGQDFLVKDSGIVAELEIDNELKQKKYLEELHLFKNIGDPILVPPEGYEYLGWMTVSGDNPLDASDNLKEALSLINYDVVKFDTASSIGKTSRKDRFSSAVLHKSALLRVAKLENIRRLALKDQRKLHIGIVGNSYNERQLGVKKDLAEVGKNIEETLRQRGYRVSFFDFNNLTKAFNELAKSDVGLIFNVCERINNSSLLEPHAASLFDVLQIPYTGSNPFTLGLCIDKIRVKKLLTYHNIPTPKWDYAYSMDDKLDEALDFPLIVKPANTDNSIGITNESVVKDRRELKKQMERVILELGRPALVEEYIEGDEYDVSILGSEKDDVRVLPLSRSIFTKLPKGYWHIYPFAAKWGNDSVYRKKIIIERPPKNISKKLESLLSEIALDTYNILDCHDYGRVEIRVDEHNNPYVLELNPNPSINMKDCLPSVAKLIGWDYGDFLEEIIRLAIKRYKNKPPYDHLQANLL